jgi:hypothetical protein
MTCGLTFRKEHVMNNVPLIYTTKGNLPEESLRLEPEWVDTADFTKLILRYYLGDEIVKESAHVYGKRPLLADAVAQRLI